MIQSFKNLISELISRTSIQHNPGLRESLKPRYLIVYSTCAVTVWLSERPFAPFAVSVKVVVSLSATARQSLSTGFTSPTP
jgi:hypothetical protein